MSKRGRGERCAYCRRRLEAVTSLSKVAATRDHTTPKSRGGTHTVWCCRQCNTLKGDATPWEWTQFMGANPEWWRLPEYQVGTIQRQKQRGFTFAEYTHRVNADPRWATGYYEPLSPDDPIPDQRRTLPPNYRSLSGSLG